MHVANRMSRAVRAWFGLLLAAVIFTPKSSEGSRSLEFPASLDWTAGDAVVQQVAVATFESFPVDNVDWVRLQSKHAAEVACKVAHGESLDVIFYGDSITESLKGTVRGWAWEKAVDIPEVWDRHFGAWQAMVLGIAGDRTVNLLWRLRDGGESPEGLLARSVVLQIGTNDFYNHYENLFEAVPMSEIAIIVAEISNGIIANSLEIRRHQPKAHIVLLALFPRGDADHGIIDDPEHYHYSLPSMFSEHIELINRRVKEFVAGQHGMIYVDCNHVFIKPSEGGFQIDPELMADALHPTAKGMDLLLRCLKPHLLHPSHHRTPPDSLDSL